MAQYNGNYTSAYGEEPLQRAELTVTLSGGNVSWSLKSARQDGSTSGERWDLYSVAVTIGGVNVYSNSYINWSGYTPGSVIASGSRSLSSLTISGGNVACRASMGIGTSASAYTSVASGNLAVANPTVNTPTYAATNKYNNNVIAGRSEITLSYSASSGSGGSITNYKVYQGNTQIYSGTATSVVFAAPSAGTYTYKVTATDSNGTSATSANLSVTTVAYTLPKLTKVTSTRWSSGSSSGSADDEGRYARLTPVFTAGKVGSTNLTTTCKITVSSYTVQTTTSGANLYTGGALSPDMSYTVTYKLYDDYIGESNAVIVRDTISVGGRGIDFCYDTATAKYGVAVFSKAEAGKFKVSSVDYNMTDTEYNNLASLLGI